VKRRDFLAGAAGALALPGAALAQLDPLDPLVRALAGGAPVRKAGSRSFCRNSPITATPFPSASRWTAR